jgi:hypothetical protein
MKRTRIVAVITLALLSALTLSQAASPRREIFARSLPTSIKWGQVEARLGNSIELAHAPKGERVRYPYSIAVTLAIRTRVAGSGAAAASTSEPIGTAYLAVAVETGKAWTTFRDDLIASLGRLPNSAYERWLDELAGVFRVSKEAGSFRFAYCLERTGSATTAGVGGRTETEDESSQGRSTSSDPKPTCETLRAAFSGGSPDYLVTSEFAVASSIEEHVALEGDIRQLQAAPSSLPSGAKIERAAAPAGAAAYSKGGRNGSHATGEELRHPAQTSESADAPDYVLRSEAAPSIISKQSLDGALQMWRFNLTKTERQFGVWPKDRASEEFVDVALFFAGPPKPVDEDAVFAAAAEALQRDDRELSGESFQGKLQESLRTLGPEDAFTVFCVPQWLRDDHAVYCAALTCSDVQNAREICRAIQSRLDS